MDMKHLIQQLDSLSHQESAIINEGVSYTTHLINTIMPQSDRPSIQRNSITKYLPAAEEKVNTQLQQRKERIKTQAKTIAEQLSPPTSVVDKVDTVVLDVPLFIRLLEYAKEDAKSDMDLHNVAANAIKINKSSPILDMDVYDAIVTPRKMT
jgi:chaperonin cofactor prefoldin